MNPIDELWMMLVLIPVLVWIYGHLRYVAGVKVGVKEGIDETLKLQREHLARRQMTEGWIMQNFPTSTLGGHNMAGEQRGPDVQTDEQAAMVGKPSSTSPKSSSAVPPTKEI